MKSKIQAKPQKCSMLWIIIKIFLISDHKSGFSPKREWEPHSWDGEPWAQSLLSIILNIDFGLSYKSSHCHHLTQYYFLVTSRTTKHGEALCIPPASYGFLTCTLYTRWVGTDNWFSGAVCGTLHIISVFSLKWNSLFQFSIFKASFLFLLAFSFKGPTSDDRQRRITEMLLPTNYKPYTLILS